MSYAGEFHPDSAKFTIDASLRFKHFDGPVTLKIDVEITHLAEECPGANGEAAQ